MHDRLLNYYCDCILFPLQEKTHSSYATTIVDFILEKLFRGQGKKEGQKGYRIGRSSEKHLSEV